MKPSAATAAYVLRCVAVCALLAEAPAGCARRETAAQRGIRAGELYRGNLSEPKDLDPHTVTGVTEHNIISALLEGLVAEDPRDLRPAPGVAERWDLSGDGTVYTFHLRPDAKWSTGDPVTAGDFAFSYRRALSPRLGCPYAYMLYCLRNAEKFHKGAITNFAEVGVEAPDARTLRLTLNAPTPYLLSMLNHYAWFPVHPPTIAACGALERMDTQWTRPGRFAGNGPFNLAEWAPGRKIVVRKSRTYWDRNSVKLNAIVFYPIGDHKIEERAFVAGQLHVTGTVPIDRIAHYRAAQPAVLRLDPYLGTYYYLLNVNRPPLDNVKVRRALAAAIDRAQIVSHVTKGGESPAFCFTPPGTAGYTCAAAVTSGVAAARALLAEAGYPGGKSFPKLELLYNTSDAHARIAQAVQQMWRDALGIQVELVNMEWKVYLARTQNGEYAVARAGWIGDYVDPNSFLDTWLTDGGNNRAGWSNAAYDGLIRAAGRTADTAERFALFQKAEKILVDEAPIIPVYFYRSKALVHPSVRGWYATPIDHHPYKHVWLDGAVIGDR